MNAATISCPSLAQSGPLHAEVLSLLLFIINERAATLKEIYPPTVFLSFVFEYLLQRPLCIYFAYYLYLLVFA